MGRLRPPELLTSTKCSYFRQYLTTALLESVEGENDYQRFHGATNLELTPMCGAVTKLVCLKVYNIL